MSREKPVVEIVEIVGHIILDFRDPYAELKPGARVHVKYLDHSVFRNADPSKMELIIQEAWGVLHHQNGEKICLIVTRHTQPGPDDEEEARATGLVIVKKAVLEIRRD